MATHCGYVVCGENLRPHSNADRLQVATFFGNDTCVGLDVVKGEIGIYFPTDLQLSEEYCEQNNLVRKKDDAGNNIGGYMDPNKRNVTTIRLRGEKSDGLYMPLSSVVYTGVNLDDLNPGDTISVINGHPICDKYIPRSNSSNRVKQGNKTRMVKAPVAPLFKEHADTEQLAYNLSAFKPGDLVEVTLKMHGTSQRTGYLPVFKEYKNTNWWGKIANAINPKKPMGSLTKKLYKQALNYAIPIYDWGYVSGTRRTVLENYEGGYYGSNEFREEHSKTFEGKLLKGETVYYEVVGFTTSGAPIMGDCDNKKLNDKEFIKQYGPTTRFSYGCVPDGMSRKNLVDFIRSGEAAFELRKPQSDIYVYRMTMTNEDGDVVEYTPDFMRYRCEQMGVKTVPVMWKGEIPAHTGDPAAISLGQNAGAWVKDVAERFYYGPDPIGKTHVREGVVVRIVNRPKFTAYKHKNFEFKCLSGIAIADAEANGSLDGLDEDILTEM